MVVDFGEGLSMVVDGADTTPPSDDFDACVTPGIAAILEPLGARAPVLESAESHLEFYDSQEATSDGGDISF